MLFSKLRHKEEEELLPPPPPFPSMEIEEELNEGTRLQLTEKPKFFDEIIKPKKAETSPEEEEFSELVKEVEEFTAPLPETIILFLLTRHPAESSTSTVYVPAVSPVAV